MSGLKIAMLFTQLETGGAQTRTFQTAHMLRARGHEVDVFAIYEARRCFENERKIVLSNDKSALNLLNAARRFIRIMRERRYDILICNTAPANIFGCLLGLISGVQARISWQTQPPQRLSRIMQQLDHLWGALGIYSRTVANSQWTRKCFDKRSAHYLNRMRTISNGITPRVEQRSRDDLRKVLGISNDVSLVVTAGRLSKQKGHETLIRAMVRVPNSCLLILGDGELRSKHQLLIEALGLNDRVKLVGEVPGPVVATYFKSADLFVFPSRWETFGLAVVEAAANGIPLVVSDLEVLREILLLPTGELACLTAPVDDVDAFATQISKVLSSPEISANLSAKSRQIVQMHSLERHVDNIEELIRELL